MIKKDMSKRLFAGSVALLLSLLPAFGALIVDEVTCVDSVVPDTAAFQAAIDAASAPGGSRVVHIQPGTCQISHANVTAKDGLTIQGNGAGSELIVAGTGLWMDLTGSRNITLRRFNVVADATNIPDVIIAWLAQAGADIGRHLTIKQVNIDAKAAKSIFVAYGFDGLLIENSVWKQRHNGPVIAAPFQRHLRTAVARVEAWNPHGLTSTHQTVAAEPNVAWDIRLDQVFFIDLPIGLPIGTQSNNISFISNRAGLLLATGGAVEGMGEIDLGIFDHSEGHTWKHVRFTAANGSGDQVTYWVYFGNGLNSQLNFEGNLLSQVRLGGAPFAIGEPIGMAGPIEERDGGVATLRIINPQLGGHHPTNHFVTVAFYCPAAALNQWVQSGDIDAIRLTLVFCGNVDRRTTTRYPKVTVPGIPDSGIILGAGATTKGRVIQ